MVPLLPNHNAFNRQERQERQGDAGKGRFLDFFLALLASLAVPFVLRRLGHSSCHFLLFVDCFACLSDLKSRKQDYLPDKHGFSTR